MFFSRSEWRDANTFLSIIQQIYWTRHPYNSWWLVCIYRQSFAGTELYPCYCCKYWKLCGSGKFRNTHGKCWESLGSSKANDTPSVWYNEKVIWALLSQSPTPHKPCLQPISLIKTTLENLINLYLYIKWLKVPFIFVDRQSSKMMFRVITHDRKTPFIFNIVINFWRDLTNNL